MNAIECAEVLKFFQETQAKALELRGRVRGATCRALLSAVAAVANEGFTAIEAALVLSAEQRQMLARGKL